MLKMFRNTRRMLGKAIIGMKLYSRHEKVNICMSICLFTIFVFLCLSHKHYIESQLHPTSSFRLQDYAEQLDGADNADEKFQYKFSLSKGKAFQPDVLSKAYLGFPQNDFVSAKSAQELDDFVFLTAASEWFVSGLHQAVESIVKFFPSKKIIVYDLGLSLNSIRKISYLPNVKMRSFHYENYPSHVEDLLTYAFKPIIIHETLRVYPGVFWVDTSVRMTSSTMSAVYEQVQTTKGILLFRNTGHSNFAVTHAQMYNYLPTSVENMKKTEQREANSILLYRTREVYNNIIKWWTLCALQVKCISPVSNIRCHITSWETYAYCHRFDQSALNILLANYFGFNDTAYVLPSEKEILTLDRAQTYIQAS